VAGQLAVLGVLPQDLRAPRLALVLQLADNGREGVLAEAPPKELLVLLDGDGDVLREGEEVRKISFWGKDGDSG
jgi:hypothetical protein